MRRRGRLGGRCHAHYSCRLPYVMGSRIKAGPILTHRLQVSALPISAIGVIIYSSSGLLCRNFRAQLRVRSLTTGATVSAANTPKSVLKW